MLVILLAFIIGVVSGLRALTGLAVLSWAARLHRIHLEGTMFAFLGYAATPYIFTLMAIGELINDKLPKTPSRTLPAPFIARLLTGAFCGAVVGVTGNILILGLLAGVLGGAVVTLGGAKVRGLLAKTLGSDLPAALLEDCVAIVLAVVVAYYAGA